MFRHALLVALVLVTSTTIAQEIGPKPAKGIDTVVSEKHRPEPDTCDKCLKDTAPCKVRDCDVTKSPCRPGINDKNITKSEVRARNRCKKDPKGRVIVD
jgi:hypothetical protein